MSDEPNAIEQIYEQINTVFGGSDPNQFFHLLIPATTLNQQSYAYDTTQAKPEIVAAAESMLVDQMFDVSTISGSSNGQRVSLQYMQALSALVPNFNPVLPKMKNALREYLNSPAPIDAMVDDEPFVGTLSEYYFALYQVWLQTKAAWVTQEINQKENSTPEKFLEWYEEHAEGRLAEIDAAMGRLLAVFSPSDMEAILGALQAGPGGELDVALSTVQDIRLPSPSGGYNYPVDLTPNNWFLGLASDTNPANLLQDPNFIALTISVRREALMASMAQIQAMISSAPTSGDLKKAADNYNSAQTVYQTAQNKLLSTYASNTATAVEMYLDAETGGSLSAIEDVESEIEKGGPALDDAKKAIDADANKVAEAKGEEPDGAKTKSGSPITADDVKKLVAGQKDLIEAQSNLLSSSQALAQAGMNLASDEARSFGDLPVMLARLKSQLEELNQLQSQVAQSASNQPAQAQSVSAMGSLSPADQALKAALEEIKTAVDAAAKMPGEASAQLVSEVSAAITAAVENHSAVQKSELARIESAANTAKQKSGSTLASVQKAVDGAIDDLMPQTPSTSTSANGLLTTKQMEAADTLLTDLGKLEGSGSGKIDETTKPQDALSPISGAISSQPSDTSGFFDQVTVAAKAAAASSSETGLGVLAKAQAAAKKLTGAPSATKSLSSDRFMTLQLSFKKSAMESSSSQISKFSQTSWSVDLFFGSASGQSSTASSDFSHNAFSSDTSIEVAFKAAKVDIGRGWFNPGIFKISEGMSRLTDAPISKGALDFSSIADGGKKAIGDMLNTYNEALLPCFPVAFVIAKDVSIKFQASSSMLSAVQSIVDSRSAAGGGFLCFSASSSSSSHSDQSSMSSKTEGTVVTINMPGPQLLGWFLEFTPEDKSSPMDGTLPPDEISIIDFVDQLKRFKGTDEYDISDADQFAVFGDETTTINIDEDDTANVDLGNSKGLLITAVNGNVSVHIDYDRGDGVYVSAIKPSSGIGNPFTVKQGNPRAILKGDLLSENVRVGVRKANVTVTY